jgi:5-bromo-4-chloroindolyl phosphate hydrolysis protein
MNGTKPKMPFTTLDCLVVFFVSSIFGMMIFNDIVLVEIAKATNQDIPVPLCGSHVTLTSKQFQSQFFFVA